MSSDQRPNPEKTSELEEIIIAEHYNSAHIMDTAVNDMASFLLKQHVHRETSEDRLP